MPRTKRPAKGKIQPAPKQTINGSPSTAPEILTLAEAAAFLRIPESEIIRQVSAQGLPGRLLGAEWRFPKAAILEWLAVKPTFEQRKAAILAAAGTFKDDPDLEDMVEDIYRKRGRPITEDGSYRLFHGLDPKDFQK
jgi:excisionase family DNA binding protein